MASQAVKQSNNVVGISDANPNILAFANLVVGDRFQPVYAFGKQHPVYTKTRHDQARQHSVESMKLKKQGYGYLEDPIVAVPANEKVRFIPFE
jgi:hypothetical protein